MHAYAVLCDGRRLQPDPAEVDLSSDADVDRWVRRTTHSACVARPRTCAPPCRNPASCAGRGGRYHPSCTCAMGSVVDADGKVLGTKGLRVVDASVSPRSTASIASGRRLALPHERESIRCDDMRCHAVGCYASTNAR